MAKKETKYKKCPECKGTGKLRVSYNGLTKKEQEAELKRYKEFEDN